MSRSRRRNRAFSLLEVIISIAVLSVGIVAVMQAISFSARVAGTSCDLVTATLFAGDRMQELEYKEISGQISSEPAQAQGEEDKFHWTSSMALDPDTSLYKFDYRISWMKQGKEEGFSLETYFRK